MERDLDYDQGAGVEGLVGVECWESEVRGALWGFFTQSCYLDPQSMQNNGLLGYSLGSR